MKKFPHYTHSTEVLQWGCSTLSRSYHPQSYLLSDIILLTFSERLIKFIVAPAMCTFFHPSNWKIHMQRAIPHMSSFPANLEQEIKSTMQHYAHSILLFSHAEPLHLKSLIEPRLLLLMDICTWSYIHRPAIILIKASLQHTPPARDAASRTQQRERERESRNEQG
jgi:hypothetical protein